MTRTRWYQIHLSTAIAMMFASSGLLGLNFFPLEEVRTNGSETMDVSPGFAAQLIWDKRNEIDWANYEFQRFRFYGWPLDAANSWELAKFQNSTWVTSRKTLAGKFSWYNAKGELPPLFWNVIIAAIVLAAVPLLVRVFRYFWEHSRLGLPSVIGGVCAVAVLVWANQFHQESFSLIAQREELFSRAKVIALIKETPRYADYPIVCEDYAGWPFECWIRERMMTYRNGALEQSSTAGFSYSIRRIIDYSSAYSSKPLLTYNVCVWLLLILTTCASSEILFARLRRRA